MIFNIIGLIIGILIFIAGVFYYQKEKQDKEARKIYSITAIVGAVITIFILIKMLI